VSGDRLARPRLGRLRRLGLQRRIMLYVTVGLALMFGVLALLGLGAIDQATQLVFQERLSTAYTTACLLESDFARVADDVQAAAPPSATGAAGGTGAAQALLDHFARVGPSTFFRISGVWLLDAQGHVLDAAGSPSIASVNVAAAWPLLRAFGGSYTIVPALGPVPGGSALATVAVRLSPASAPRLAVVTTVSANSRADYIPSRYGRPNGGAPAAPAAPTTAAEAYRLEVLDAQGIVLLGIGADEQAGQVSEHYPVIKSLMARGGAAALLHEPGPGDHFPPHVMAVVPVAGSPLYLVLEQPIDVALALPMELRQRLILTIAVGFLAALVVAWITTRHVVKPTEQLTAAAGRMARGDLATPIAVRAEDEVGELAESLEAMRQRMRAAQDAIEQTNRELEARVAERTARLGELLHQTINAQEDERRRLARELHDETAQTLAALSIALDRARDEADGDASRSLSHIRAAREIAGRLLAETRQLILGLRPTVLDDMGLLPAIRWYAESTLSDQGVEVTIDVEGLPDRFPAAIEVTLFRIVQEAITNVAKHAHAGHVRIHLGLLDGAVRITVADDGRGFDVPKALESGSGAQSVGLLGMLERVRLLNGSMEIQSSPGVGSTVRVDAPIIGEGA